MIRFLLFTFLFYIAFLVVTNVLRALFGATKRRPDQSPQDTPTNQPAKPTLEYKDVAEAKFKDISENKSVKPGEE